MNKVILFSLLAVCMNSYAETSFQECMARGHAYQAEAEVTVKPSIENRCRRSAKAFDFFQPFCIDLNKRNQVRKTYSKSNPELMKSLEKMWKEFDQSKKYQSCNK